MIMEKNGNSFPNIQSDIDTCPGKTKKGASFGMMDTIVINMMPLAKPIWQNLKVQGITFCLAIFTSAILTVGDICSSFDRCPFQIRNTIKNLMHHPKKSEE